MNSPTRTASILFTTVRFVYNVIKYATAVLAVALAALVIALTAGCTPKGAGDDGNLMVFYGSHSDDVKSFDPAVAYDTISWDVVPSVYETLYQYDYLAEPYRVVPLLAADFPKYSADRLTVTIPLRKDVSFQDDPAFKDSRGRGRAVTAHDYIFGFKRLAQPSLRSPGFWIFDGKIAGFTQFQEMLAKTPEGDVAREFLKPVEGLRAIDDTTLEIRLTRPYPQLLYVLSLPFTAPVAHEAISAYADETGAVHEKPVGTGPFTLVKWERGHQIVLERNPNYHPDFYPTTGSATFRQKGLLADAGRPVPFLDRVVIRVMKEQQPAWLGFLQGQLDVMTLPKDNFDAAITNRAEIKPELESKGIRLSIESGTYFYYISFNMKDRLIGGNRFLRQAMSSALDRSRWVELFTNGRGEKMVTALPPGIAGRVENATLKYGYDLDRARELLKKAGYPGGKGLPTINFDMRNADSVTRQLGEFVKDQFGAIGIQVNVIYNTFPAYLEKMRKGNLQVAMSGWGLDYPDAENVYQLLYGKNAPPGPNDSSYSNPEYDKLYEEMAVIEAGPRRSELIRKLDEIVQEDVPWAFGYYRTNYRLTNPWLLNFRGSDIIMNAYKYYRVNKDVKKRYLSAQ